MLTFILSTSVQNPQTGHNLFAQRFSLLANPSICKCGVCMIYILNCMHVFVYNLLPAWVDAVYVCHELHMSLLKTVRPIGLYKVSAFLILITIQVTLHSAYVKHKTHTQLTSIYSRSLLVSQTQSPFVAFLCYIGMLVKGLIRRYIIQTLLHFIGMLCQGFMSLSFSPLLLRGNSTRNFYSSWYERCKWILQPSITGRLRQENFLCLTSCL